MTYHLPPGSFLAWFDDGKHTTPVQRLSDALSAYQDRTGVAANVALMAEPCDAPAGVTVAPRASLGPHTVWVGREL